MDSAWGFGSDELAAPQATLMKMIIEGVMEANLPWGLVFVGIFIAVIVEILGIPVLPFAIGVYLPVHLNACIMVGGIVRWFVEKVKTSEKKKTMMVNDGILFCSGMIAGEGIVGIILAILAIFGLDKAIDLSAKLNLPVFAQNIGGILVFALVVVCLLKFSVWKKQDDWSEEA